MRGTMKRLLVVSENPAIRNTTKPIDRYEMPIIVPKFIVCSFLTNVEVICPKDGAIPAPQEA
jgi:hypothetical protein